MGKCSFPAQSVVSTGARRATLIANLDNLLRANINSTRNGLAQKRRRSKRKIKQIEQRIKKRKKQRERETARKV